MANLKSNLPNAPVLKSFTADVEAVYYNNIFLALSRISAPLKIMLPGLRGIEVRLDRDAWVCFDHNLNHQPLLAWTNFRPGVRTSLYQAVPSQLLFYHPYATVLVRSLPGDINRVLIKRLARVANQPPAKVIIIG